MFRSFVSAFYLLASRHFYGRGWFHGGRLRTRFMRLDAHSEIKKVVYRMSEVLFAAEIAFRRLHGCMPQQELNLLKLATAAMAQLRTSPPQVVRCNMLQSHSFAAGLDHVPHNVLRDTFAPYLSGPGNGSKDFAFRDARLCYP